MPTSPSISVVTPSLNQGEFIAQTIESVASQGYAPLEHRIYDGGSTDSTAAVLARYRSQIIATVEPDGGQAAAVNRGLREAKGEIVGWLNSDDFYYPGALRAVGEHFASHPECSALYGAAHYVNAQGEPLDPYPTGDPHELRFGCFICQPTVFIRKRVIAEVGALDESLRFCMDYDLWLRIAERFEFHRIPNVLAAYRLHETSKSVAEQLNARRETVEMMHRRTGAAPLTSIYGYADLLAKERFGAHNPNRPLVRLMTMLNALALTVRYHPRPTREDLTLIRQRLRQGSALAPGSLPDTESQ